MDKSKVNTLEVILKDGCTVLKLNGVEVNDILGYKISGSAEKGFTELNLSVVIAEMKTAQEVPVQEQFEENFNPETGIKLYDVCPKCWVKGDIPYQCGFSKCPGYKILTKKI